MSRGRRPAAPGAGTIDRPSGNGEGAVLRLSEQCAIMLCPACEAQVRKALDDLEVQERGRREAEGGP